MKNFSIINALYVIAAITVAMALPLPMTAQTIGDNYIKEKVMRSADGHDCMESVHYYDGLGRQVQTVAVAASPHGNDIVDACEIDGVGRTVRSWNATACGTGGAQRSMDDVRRMAIAGYGDDAPYSTARYEQSSLGRLMSETGPGEAWHRGNRGKKTGYMFNDNSVDSLSCFIFRCSDTRLATDTVITMDFVRKYQDGTLSVTSEEDEEGDVTLMFTDRSGRNVLQRRKADNGKWSDTYYIYDVCGNLTAVLPPAVTSKLGTGRAFRSDEIEEIGQFAYLYLYDRDGRCRAKKLPGCAWQLFVFDCMGRTVFSQDGEQRRRGEWVFTLRDRFGRDCVTGLCKASFDVLRQGTPDFFMHAVRDDTAKDLYGYTTESSHDVSIVSSKILHVCYYDNYSFVGGPRFPDHAFAYRQDDGYGNRYAASATTFLTGELTAVLGIAKDTTFIGHVYYYDDRGQVVQSCASNILGGYDREDTRYDFTGNVTARRVRHSTVGITEEHAYTYDQAGRLLTETMRLNGGNEVTLSERTYDEVGRLASIGRGGNAILATGYEYNVRSWPVHIGGRLFGERLMYEDADTRPRHDGNIAAAAWTCEDDMAIVRYTYDRLKRLTYASYNGKFSEDYSAEYGYDEMGNVRTLVRRGRRDDGAFGYLDIINCRYDGNRLIKADNSAVPTYRKGVMTFRDGSTGGVEYFYDSDGRIVADVNRGLGPIVYNATGLPQAVIMENGTINFVHSADGQKLRVRYRMSGTNVSATANGNVDVYSSGEGIQTTTDICGNIRCRDGKLQMLLFDGGYVRFKDGQRDSTEFIFYLRDHLGSNRVAVTQGGKVIERNHFYPYGALTDCSSMDGTQPFKFNGKELDRMLGLDWMDYGARWYDPTLPRWTTMDPLCEEYYDVSPYAFCLGNPVNTIDRDGREPIYNLEGKLLGTSKEGFKGTIYVYKGIDEGIEWSKHDMKYWTDENNGYKDDIVTYDQVEAVYSGTRHATFAKNVINNIARHFNGTKLFNDRTFSMASLEDGEIKYTDKENSHFTTFTNDKTRIEFHGRTYKDYEGTVENMAASLLIHEWYSHGEYKIGDNHVDKRGKLVANHRFAYLNVKKDKIFYPKTTSNYKEFINLAYKFYIKNDAIINSKK